MRQRGIHPELGAAILPRKVADDLDRGSHRLASEVARICLGREPVGVRFQHAPAIRLGGLFLHLDSDRRAIQEGARGRLAGHARILVLDASPATAASMPSAPAVSSTIDKCIASVCADHGAST